MKTPREEWLLLFTLAAIQFCHVLDFIIMMPLGPQFMRVFEIGPTEFGWMISSFTFSAAAFGILTSFFADRFDRRSMLLFLYGGFTVGTLLCALAPDHVFFTAARAFAGAFSGPMVATVYSIIGDAIPVQRRGAAMGTVMASFSAASILGVPFGLELANRFGWHAPFFAIVAMSLVVWTIAFRALPPVRSHLTGESYRAIQRLLENIREKNHQRAFVFTVALVLGQFTVFTFLSPYYVANVGVSERELFYVYLVGGACTLFTSRMFGKLADRIGNFRVFAGIAVLSIIPLLITTNLPKVALPVAVLASTAMMVLASGRMVVANSMITSSVVSQRRGGFLSLNTAVQSMALAIAAWIAGKLVTQGVDGALMNFPRVGLFAAGCTVLAIWLAARMRVA